MSDTLLLSQSYEPIATISWQKAVTLLTLGKIEIIEEYDDRELRSRTWIIKMPAVARLVHSFGYRRQRVNFTRQNILARDGWKCQYCGDKLNMESVTYDHVTPRMQGGTTCWTNIVSCCSYCNSRKGGRTPKQAEMILLRHPVEPTWVPIFSITTQNRMPQQWRDYVYWNGELDE